MAAVPLVVIVFVPSVRSVWNRMRNFVRAVARIRRVTFVFNKNHQSALAAAALCSPWMNSAHIVHSSYVQNARLPLPRMTPFAPNVKLNLNMPVPNAKQAYPPTLRRAPIVGLNFSPTPYASLLNYQLLLQYLFLSETQRLFA